MPGAAAFAAARSADSAAARSAASAGEPADSPPIADSWAADLTAASMAAALAMTASATAASDSESGSASAGHIGDGVGPVCVRSLGFRLLRILWIRLRVPGRRILLRRILWDRVVSGFRIGQRRIFAAAGCNQSADFPEFAQRLVLLPRRRLLSDRFQRSQHPGRAVLLRRRRHTALYDPATRREDGAALFRGPALQRADQPRPARPVSASVARARR